ncbi:unnamed protein product [Lymnaea stagnalis]|uniref:RecF/RecN/SMC N-terminal domain-containing protein n=1 Tax=Lymnaea stagnalis TaxID=6523 RepID=A0AAV2ILM0_LYMST
MQKRVWSAKEVATPEVEGKRYKSHVASSEDSEDDDENEDTDVIESSIADPLGLQLLSEHKPVVGIIQQITLNNFMCHNHLEVVPGSHVNFVVGRNGSGKSAIVTALVVGLGGKASVTSRGTSIKNFIKSGKRTAFIEVILNNRGRDSFKHHIYGDKIIVRRKFSIDGGSTYAICTASGQHVCARHEELQRIKDHLNIQVDNPVVILNQDTSRNFLNSRSAGDKFKFFMKATQLEQMNSDYDKVKANKNETKQLMVVKEQVLPEMKKEVKVWENKFKNLMALSGLKDKIKSLKEELAWSLVAEKERGLKPLEKNCQSEEAALPRYIQKLEQAKGKQEEWQEQQRDLEQRLMACANDVQELEPLLQQKKKEMQQAKELIVPINNKLKAFDKELHVAQQERKQCHDRILELKTLASHDYEAERQQRLDQIKQLKGKLEKIESEKKVMGHDMEQYRSAVAKSKSELLNLDGQLKMKQTKLRDVRSTCHRLEAAKSDRLQRFGEWMPGIIKSIESKKSQFHKMPKGPLGACFDLVDHKWALAVESCLKSLVSSFVCHDHHDEMILEDIFKRDQRSRNSRPTIITSQFVNEVYDVSRYRVRSATYPCLLDVIRCDDPVIVNTLIDQRGVENVVLIENSDEARAVMLRDPPEKAKECFTVSGDQLYSLPTFRYYSSDKTIVRYLMADVNDQIRDLLKEEKQLEEEIRIMNRKHDECQKEIARNQQEEKKCLTQLNKMTENTSRLTFEITELQTVEDPSPVDVTTLEEEVEAYNQKIEDMKTKREALLLDKKKADENLKVANENYTRLEASLREKSDNAIPLKEEISQAQAELGQARDTVKHYASKLKEQEQKIQELKQKLESYKKEVDEDRMKASEYCEPVNTKRTPNSIEREITETKRRIDEEEVQQGNEELITTTYKQKREALERVIKEVNQLNKYIKKLEEVLAKRDIAYQKMRKLIANRAKYFFLIQMSQRSFTGTMNFDFNKETLEICVNTTQETKAAKANSGLEKKDLKSLSGGERSFSTVCFILSLWETMDAPFRCLDEFDVFMDMVNRRISMDMMMSAADMHKNKQFIFLTPQDMSSVRKISNVKIFRMQDPERNKNEKIQSGTPSSP